MPTVLKLVRTKEGSPRDSIRLAGKTAHKITSINTPVPNVAAKSKPEGLLAQPVAHAVSLGQQITLQTPSQPSIPPTTGVLVNPNPLFGTPQPCLIVPQAIAPQQSVLIQNVKPMIQPALPYVSAERYEVNPYLGNYTEKREKKNAKSTMQTDTVEVFGCQIRFFISSILTAIVLMWICLVSLRETSRSRSTATQLSSQERENSIIHTILVFSTTKGSQVHSESSFLYAASSRASSMILVRS